MEGLRTHESNKFKEFFSIVQSTAKEKDSIFFLDSGDGRDFETSTMEGEDLMGWLIPQNKAAKFKVEWACGDVSDDWSDYYVWAVWEKGEKITVKFI